MSDRGSCGYLDQFSPRKHRDKKDRNDFCLDSDPARCPVAYDSSMRAIHDIFEPSQSVTALEEQLWGVLRGAALEGRPGDVSQFFEVSQGFMRLLGAASDEGFSRLVQPSLMSFAPLRSCQEDLERHLTMNYSGRPWRERSEPEELYWADMLSAVKERRSETDTCSIVLGLAPSLISAIRAAPAHDALAEMKRVETRLKLRYSEDVACNIMFCRDERRLHELAGIRLMQIASGPARVRDLIMQKLGIVQQD